MTPRGLIFASVLLASFVTPCWAANKELAMCVAVGATVEATNDLVCQFSATRGSVLIILQNNRAWLQRGPP